MTRRLSLYTTRISDRRNRRSAIPQRNRWPWFHQAKLHFPEPVGPEGFQRIGALTIKDPAINDHKKFAVDCCFLFA